MDVQVLLNDYSFLCTKIYTPSWGRQCLCDFSDLPGSFINNYTQLACEHRKVSFLGLLSATLQDYGMKTTLASLLGASIAGDFMYSNLPVAKLSCILGPDVPVQAFIHTSSFSTC